MTAKLNYEFMKNFITKENLFILSILLVAFTISLLLRIGPLDYGWELNEFDPFYNFRATQFILENGLDNYYQWHDDLSWYPNGRNISATSQVFLHLFTALTFSIFNMGMSLYDYTIIFPAIIGSLTCFVLFGILRNIFGTTAGLFSALMFSISIPILSRGSAGWFKSEPLGLFLSLLSLWLFLSALNSKSTKNSIIRNTLSGIIFFLSLSAWGGNQFFLILLGLFILILPLIRNDSKNLIWKILPFTISIIAISFFIERPGTNFLFSLNGLVIILPTLFLIVSSFIIKHENQLIEKRNYLILLVSCIVLFSIFIILNNELEIISMPSFRYLNSINPFLTNTSPLVDSVSEHLTTNIHLSFLFHGPLLIFSGIGIWSIFTKNNSNHMVNEMRLLCIIFGILGAYMGATFTRLEVFTSLSLIILSSIGITILFKELFNSKFTHLRNYIKIIFIFGIFSFLIIPLTLTNVSPIYTNDYPQTILTGGAQGKYHSNDWIEALDWIKNNTDEDSKIISWWDYGYWIETKGERTTFIDNATIETRVIKNIAETFFSTPEDGWKRFHDMEADYVVIFLTGEKIPYVGEDNQNLYLLTGGGDETKKFWIAKIAEKNISEFLHDDFLSGTQKFWNDTLFGQLIPFSLVGYVDPQTNNQYFDYVPGTIAIYEKSIKYNSESDPFNLVFSSSGFSSEKNGLIKMILIYKINKNFI